MDYRLDNAFEPHTRCKPSGGPRQFITPYGVEFVVPLLAPRHVRPVVARQHEEDAAGLARRLKEIPGVVEHGLFVNMADIVLIGKGEEVLELRR